MTIHNKGSNNSPYRSFYYEQTVRVFFGEVVIEGYRKIIIGWKSQKSN